LTKDFSRKGAKAQSKPWVKAGFALRLCAFAGTCFGSDEKIH
jgi:hypothetical protein